MAVAVGMDTAVYGSTTVSTRYTIRAAQSGRQLRKETPDWGGKLEQYHNSTRRWAISRLMNDSPQMFFYGGVFFYGDAGDLELTDYEVSAGEGHLCFSFQ